MLPIRIFLLVMLLALPTLQTENIYKILPKGRNTRKLALQPDFTITNTDNDASLENPNLSDKQRKFLKYMFDYPDITNILPDEENPDSIALKKYFETHHTPLATIISKFFGRKGKKYTNKDISLEAIAIGDVPTKINSKEQEFLKKKEKTLANEIKKESHNNITGTPKTNFVEVEQELEKITDKKEDSTILENIIPQQEETKIISVIHPSKANSKPVQEQEIFVKIPAEERKMVPGTTTVIQEVSHKIGEDISSNGQSLSKETPKTEKFGPNHIKNEKILLEKQIKPLEIEELLAKTNPPQKEETPSSAEEVPEKEIPVTLGLNHVKNEDANKYIKETPNQKLISHQKPSKEVKIVHSEDVEKDEMSQHRPIVVMNQVTGVPEIHVPVTIVEEKPVEKVTQKPEVYEVPKEQIANSRSSIFSATLEKDPKSQNEEKLTKNEVKDILSTKYDTPVPEKNTKSSKGSKHQERFLFFNDDKSEENFGRKNLFGGRNNKGVIEIDYVGDMNPARLYKHLDEYSGENIHGIVPHSSEDTLEVINEPLFQKKIIRFPGDRSHERIPVDEPVVMKAHFEALTSSNSEEELLVQPIRNKKKPKYPAFSRTRGRNFERMLDLPEINQSKSNEQQNKSKVKSEAKDSAVSEKKPSNVEATMSNQSSINEDAIRKTAISPETNVSKSGNLEIPVPHSENKTHKFSAKFAKNEKLSSVEKEGNISKEEVFTHGNDPKVPKVSAKTQNTSQQNSMVVAEEKVEKPTTEMKAPVVSKENISYNQNSVVIPEDKVGNPLEDTEVKTAVDSKETKSSHNSAVVPEKIPGKLMETKEINASKAFSEHEKAFEEKQKMPAEKVRMFSVYEDHGKNKINKDEQRIQPKVSSEKENEEILVKIEPPSSHNGSKWNFNGSTEKMDINKSENQNMEPKSKSKTEEGPKSLNKSNVFQKIPEEKIDENITKTADNVHQAESQKAISKPEVFHQKEKNPKTLNKSDEIHKIHQNPRTTEENVSKTENIGNIKDIINVSISEDNNGSHQEVIPTLKTIFHEETESSEEIPIKISHPKEFSRRKGGFQTLKDEAENNQDVVPTLRAIFAESNGSSGENLKMKASPEQMDRLYLPKEDIRQIFEAKFEESNESNVEKLDEKLPKSTFGNQKLKHTIEARFEESNESSNENQFPKRMDRLFFPKEVKPSWDTKFVDSNESSEELGIKAAKRIPINNIIREGETKKTFKSNSSWLRDSSRSQPDQKHPPDSMEKPTNVVKNAQNNFFKEDLNSSSQQGSEDLKLKEEIVPQNDSKKMSGSFQKEVSEKKLTEEEEKDQKLQEIGRKLKVLQTLLKIKQNKKDANVDNILMRMHKLRKVQRQLNNPVIWPAEEKSKESMLSVENKSVEPKLPYLNKLQKENKEDYLGMRNSKSYATPEEQTWSKIIQEEEIKKSFDYFQNPSMYGNFQPKQKIFEETIQKDIRPIYDTSTFPGDNNPFERRKPNDFPLHAFRKEFEGKSSKENQKVWKNKKENAFGKILDSIEEIDSFKEDKSSGTEKIDFNKKPAALGNEFLETILKVKNEDVKKEEIPKVSTEVKPKHDIEAIFFKEMKDKMENRQKLHQILAGIQNKDDASEEDMDDVLIPSKKIEKLNYEKPKKIGVIENIYGLDQAFGESRHENKENIDISFRNKIIGIPKKHSFEDFRSSGLESRSFNEKSSSDQENIEEPPKEVNKASGMVASSDPKFHFFREENIEDIPKQTNKASGMVASSNPEFHLFREENIQDIPKETINSSGKVPSSNPEFHFFREDNIEELPKDIINSSGMVATSKFNRRPSAKENVFKFDKIIKEKEKSIENKAEHIPKKKISYSKYKNEDLEDLPRLLSKTTEVEEVSKFDEIFEDKEKSQLVPQDKKDDLKKSSSFFKNQESFKPKQVNFEAFEAQSAEEVDDDPKTKNRASKMEEFGFNKNNSFDKKERFDKISGDLKEEDIPKKKNGSSKGKGFGKHHLIKEQDIEKLGKEAEMENISQFDKVFEDLSAENFEDFPKTKVETPKMKKHSFEEHKFIKSNGKVSKFDKIFPGRNDDEILKKKVLEEVNRKDFEDFPQTRMVPSKMKKHSSEEPKSIEISRKVPKIDKFIQEENNGEIFAKKKNDFPGKDQLIDQAMIEKEQNYSKYEKILEEKRKTVKNAQETKDDHVEGSSSNLANIFSDEVSKKDLNIEQPKTIVEKESRYIPPRFRVAKFTNPRSNEDFNKHLHHYRPSYFDIDKMTEKEHRIEKELHRRNTNHHKYFENKESNLKNKRRKIPLDTLVENMEGAKVEKTNTFSDDSDKFVYVKDKRDKYQFVVKAKPIEQNVRTASTKIKIIKDVPEKVIKDVPEDDLNTDFFVNVMSQDKSSKKSRKNNYIKVPFPENKLGNSRFENMDGYSKGFKVIKATDEGTFTL